MASRDYSFLDIAVLDDVRSRFAAGDALAVLSTDLEEVIWANGPGAALFGYGDIEAIIGAQTRLPFAARRQIMAAPGYPDIGRDRSIAVRLASGMTSRMVGFLASRILLPDGDAAILLALPAVHGASRSEADIAERAIGGFREAGHFVALIDTQGGIVAASEGFAELGIADETLAGLAAEVRHAPDRLVKRLLRTGAGRLPAGVARLADDPPLSLLVVVNEDQAEIPPAVVTETEKADALEKPVMLAEAPAGAKAAPENDMAPQTELPPSSVTIEKPTDAVKAEDDHWYFHAGEEKPAGEGTARPVAEPTETVAPAPQAVANGGRSATENGRAAAAVRFVWRTDADGRFSAISDEFAGAVGEFAADVIGRKFSDVATILGFDPDKEIARLLERRDTWSGRSVLWPVAGTDLRIPVDLAALPAYDRSRAFEGFRGFGVARTGDAVVDPEGIGLTLTPHYRPAQPSVGREPTAGEAPTETAAREGPKRQDPFKGEVPVLTIVPKPERRHSDKIIRLAEHRPPANEKGLTPVERSAFREIGDRLKKESAPGDIAEDKALPLRGDNDHSAMAAVPPVGADDAKPVEAEALGSQQQSPENDAAGASAPAAAATPDSPAEGSDETVAVTEPEIDDFAAGQQGGPLFDRLSDELAADRDDEPLAAETAEGIADDVRAAPLRSAARSERTGLRRPASRR